MRHAHLFRTKTIAAVGVGAVCALALTVPGGASASTATVEVRPNFPPGPALVQHKPARVANHTGIRGVLAYDTKGYPAPGTPDAGTIRHTHVHTTVQYAVTPPVGGPHNEKWLNAGIYTQPLPASRATHDLEHGAVWITYSPQLSKAALNRLYQFVNRQTVLRETATRGNRYIILSPWKTRTLKAPIAISSWGYSLTVIRALDPRLQQFVNTFRRNTKYSPETDSPVDGQPVKIGGHPLRDGSVYLG